MGEGTWIASFQAMEQVVVSGTFVDTDGFDAVAAWTGAHGMSRPSLEATSSPRASLPVARGYTVE